MLVPAFALFGGVSIQENSGSVTSSSAGVDGDAIKPLEPGPIAPQITNAISQRYFSKLPLPLPDGTWVPNELAPTTGSARSVFPHVGASVELAAPMFSLMGFTPFVHGDAIRTFDVDHTAATAGDPSDPQVPVLGTLFPPSLETVSGVGVKVSGEEEPWVFGAGAGLSYALEIFGRQVRIKPSFEYRYDEITATAYVSGAGAGGSVTDRDFQGNVSLQAMCPCITGVAGGKKTQSFHSIGPGLEFEMDAARAGPVMLTLFMSAQAYRVLGDREIDVAGDGSWNFHSMAGDISPYVQTPDPALGYLADPLITTEATYEREAWSYRTNVGLRFRWLPK